MPPSTPSRKVSPPSTTATPLPLRSPHLHRVQSRSTPAPPILGMESTSIRDRRHGSRSVSSSSSGSGSGSGEGSTIRANEEDRTKYGYGNEYGHQRRPADGPPTASGPGRNPHLGLGANNPNGMLFRSPSSEPSWQAQGRRDHQSGLGSSARILMMRMRMRMRMGRRAIIRQGLLSSSGRTVSRKLEGRGVRLL
jgi:hypothetical protein